MLNDLKKLKDTDRAPVIFVGHGNPMYAITDNPYRKKWNEIGGLLTKPAAILCVSAHWLTNGTYVAMAENPLTIHDFYGFPDELFKVQYPAAGSPSMAKETIDNIKQIQVKEDFDWGLDHGAWSVLKNIYPNADVPVFQMSIDYSMPASYHFDIAKELKFLRDKGVLILASGNAVHNLRMVKWHGDNTPYDWALEFDEIVKKSVEDDTPEVLIDYEKLGSLASIAHPTNDHFLPLLYALAVRKKTDRFEFFNDSIDMGSMSMRSVIFY